MTILTVSSTNQFHAALKSVKAGDTIRLAPGTYDKLKIQHLSLPGNVTITSADPRHPAVITDMIVRDSANLTFQSLEFSTKAGGMNTVLVFQSNHIVFDQVEVHGPLGLGSATSASPFMIRESAAVTVQNSEFHDVWHALALLDTTGTVVRGNSFHDVRTDGVRGGGNSNLLVEGNLFTDFHPAAGDHADAIQLWSTNQTVAAYDITIRGNLVVRGNGDAIQGIFVRDTFDKLPFRNVVVEGNTILGAAYHGITLDGVVGGAVRGNTVLGTADQRAWIRVIEDHGVTIAGNTSTFYNLPTKTDPRLAANALVDPSEAANQAAIRAWAAGHGAEARHWATDLADLLHGGNDIPVEAVPAVTTTRSAEATHDTGVQRLGDGETLLRLHDAGEGHGNNGDNRLVGTGGDDVLHGHGGDDLLQGLEGDDVLLGGDGNDDLRGDAGDDQLFGGAGDDRLVGGIGDDRLDGGDGKDVLEAGSGDDWLTGGAGADTFAYRTGDLAGKHDTITDWQAGLDKLSFRGVDLDPATSVRDPLSWIGDHDFSHHAGEVRWEWNGADVHVTGDLDGDGQADFLVVLQHALPPVAGDVLL